LSTQQNALVFDSVLSAVGVLALSKHLYRLKHIDAIHLRFLNPAELQGDGMLTHRQQLNLGENTYSCTFFLCIIFAKAHPAPNTGVTEMNQENNFHIPEAVGLSRNSDPETSKAAAKTITRDLERVVLEGIKTFTNGCTADELVKRLNMRWDSVTPRFAPLLRAGYIIDTGMRRKGSSGRAQRVVIAAKKAWAE
jgi:hypothetical protein